MKTRDLSTLQIVFLALTLGFFILAVLSGVFVSIVAAAVCIIIATCCFVVGMFAAGKEPAPSADAKPQPAATAKEEKSTPSPVKPQPAAVKKMLAAKQPCKGFPKSIVLDDKDYDLREQFFDVKVEGSFPLGIPLALSSDVDKVNIINEENTIGAIEDEKYVKMVSAWQKKKYSARAKAYEADGVFLVVAFFAPHPTKRVFLRSGIPSRSFKLGGVNTEEFESYAEDLSAGDELEFEYNSSDDRYENLAGYLPRNANAFIEEDPTIGFVESVETDDDDKLKVYVTVYERPVKIETPDELMKKDEKSPYEEETYTVKGVTFNTGVSGRKTRQGILRSIYFKDPPFDGDFEIVPKVYEYEGKPAVGLYVNGDENEQIGNIPKEAATRIANMMDRYVGSSIKVYGGGDHNWGAEITLRFSNAND